VVWELPKCPSSFLQNIIYISVTKHNTNDITAKVTDRVGIKPTTSCFTDCHRRHYSSSQSTRGTIGELLNPVK